MRVVVIGAGVQGITSAYFLNKQGLDVTVIERTDAAGMECSYGNGGGLTPSVAAPWNDPDVYKMLFRYLGKKNAPLMFRIKALPSLIGWGLKFLSYANEKTFIHATRVNTRLCQYSLEMMDDITRDTAINFEAKTNGLMLLFRDEAQQSSLEKFYDLLKDEGLQYRSLDVQSTIEQEPALKPIQDNISGSMFFEADRSGNCPLFCQELAKVIAQRGVQFQYNTAVNQISKNDKGFYIVSDKGEHIEADSVVIAAGSYSPFLCQTLGVNLPVKPAKGYSLSVPLSNGQEKIRSIIADMSVHAGLNMIGEDTLRVAGTAEFAGYDTKLDKDRIDNLFWLLDQVCPEVAAKIERNNVETWTGLRPMSVDSRAIVGRTPVDNLYISTGQGHIGWTTAAASGRIVADQVTGQKSYINVDEYSLSRFG